MGKKFMKKILLFLLVFTILASGVFYTDSVEIKAKTTTDNFNLNIYRADEYLNKGSVCNNMVDYPGIYKTIILAADTRETTNGNKINSKPVKVSKKKVRKAYQKYIKEVLSHDDIRYDDYLVYDFNKDGIEEMIAVSVGARAAMYVYTYYKGKVTPCLGDSFFNDIGYISENNHIVGGLSGGADYSYLKEYKLAKGKLKEINTYSYEEGTCKKNGKTISSKSYQSFYNKIVYPKWDDMTKIKSK